MQVAGPRETTAALLAASAGLLALGILAHVMLAVGSESWRLGALVDTDSYSRLMRATRLWQEGGWYDRTLPQLGAPDGLQSHWTRLLDLLILLGAWPAMLAGVAPAAALYWSAALVCPVLHLLACLAAVWAARGLWPANWSWFAGLVLLLDATALGYSVFGRSDHHTLVLLSAVVGLGFALRAARGVRGAAMTAGGVFGVGVWVSPETLIVAMPVLVAFGLLWLRGREQAASAGLRMALGLAGAVALALPVERPPSEWLLVDQDRVSVQHLALALVVAAVFAAVGRLPPWRAMLPRLLAGGACALVGAGVLLLAWPDLLRASNAAADGEMGAIFLASVMELQPLRFTSRDEVAQAIGTIGSLVPAILALLLGLATRQDKEDRAWGDAALVVTVALAAGGAAAIWARRFGVDLAGPAAIAAAGFVPMVTTIMGQVSPILRLPSLLAAAVVGIFLPIAGMAAVTQQPKPGCDAAALGRWMSGQSPGWAGAVLFPDSINIGPATAFFAQLRAVTGPYHQLGDAFADTRRLFQATDDAETRALVTRRRATLVAVCTAAPALGQEWAAGGLRGRLLADDHPDWLEPITLPPELAETFRLYAVRPGP